MRRLFALFITLSLISCQKDTNSYTLEGDATGYVDGTPIYVYEVYKNQPKVIDTIKVMGGKFSATYPKSDDASIRYLRMESINTSIIFFPENVDLKATIYMDSLSTSFVSGSKLNDSYTAFSKKIREFNTQKQANMQRFQLARQEQDNLLITQIQGENMALVEEETNYKIQFAMENGNSIFSVMLITEMLTRKEISAADATNFLANVSPKVAALPITDDLKVMIANSKKADVGSPAPDFSAPTPTGENFSLSEAMGKYTIIDFWASWCRPCRLENPNVVNVYNKYHDKGLNIISVSLDKEGQKERWIQAIKDDKMDWYHISNLKFWNDPIARMYNVRSIPATFLLDENGTIIAKNLRGPALGAKIESLLGQ
ncbi:MAG: AhpC/TSA family protein [Altibacter sp.]|uniref:TlpA disulfide reductase family protein n=1 Tax=Altibacter sp. TaxID=2024823 RepID=UPI001D7F8B0E|nr:TlpA disulfide reductase family protein [Altibacter sp.]MBZ0326136.1 AhpC/TSA family protein [Altibacter sp.]